jgi:hypothetical protein
MRIRAQILDAIIDINISLIIKIVSSLYLKQFARFNSEWCGVYSPEHLPR